MSADARPGSRRRLPAQLLALALIVPLTLSLAPLDARAIVINEHAFQRFGGDLVHPEAHAAHVDQHLLAESVKPRFRSAGLLKLAGIDRAGCHQTNGTWLGEDEAHVYILAGAYCLSGQDPNAQTRLAHVEFVDWQGRSVIRGEARVFFPAHGRAKALALVRVPRPADQPLDPLRPLLPPAWISDTYRYKDGQFDQVPRAMEGVGYGAGGVGTQVSRPAARRFGATVREDDAGPDSARLRYDAHHHPHHWARAAPGDNGSGWYERWQREALLTDLTTGFGPTSTGTARVAAYARWIEGLHPGVRMSKASAHVLDGSWAEGFPLTERRPLVTTDLSLDGLTGERRSGLYYAVPGAPAIGPMRSGTPGHTAFQVTVKDAQSGVMTQLTLRGQKMTPCAGLLPMNDPTDCAEGGDGRLKLSYWPEDNPTLAPGRVFVGTFDIGARVDLAEAPGQPGRRQFFQPDVWRVNVRIDTRRWGRVTATQPFEWDYQGAVHRAGVRAEGEARRANRFMFRVPVQRGVSAPVEVQTGGPHRLVAVAVHDVLRQTFDWQHIQPNSFDKFMPLTTRVLHLRARMGPGCGEARPCAPQDRKRRLTVSFQPEDNPGLPPGLYRGRFELDGSHSGGAGAEQNKLSVDVEVETL